jgi:hypothetical protein
MTDGKTAAIVTAAERLVRCNGRYHSEMNMIALAALFGVKLPPSEVAAPQAIAPLSDDQIEEIAQGVQPILRTGHPSWEHAIARAIERAHGIGAAMGMEVAK